MKKEAIESMENLLSASRLAAVLLPTIGDHPNLKGFDQYVNGIALDIHTKDGNGQMQLCVFHLDGSVMTLMALEVANAGRWHARESEVNVDLSVLHDAVLRVLDSQEAVLAIDEMKTSVAIDELIKGVI